MKTLTQLTVLGASAFLFASTAAAQTLTNASFEQNSSANDTHVWSDNQGGNITPPTGTAEDATYIPGWTILRNSTVDVWQSDTSRYEFDGHINGGMAGAPVTATNGSRFLSYYNDNAVSPSSTTAQTTATALTSGQQYKVTFDYAAAGWREAGQLYTAEWQVKTGSTSQTYAALNFTGTGSNPEGLPTLQSGGRSSVYIPWQTGTFLFTANSTTAVLDFVGKMQGGPTQLYLDNIRIAAVPEPSFAAASLSGLAGLTLLRRKRR